MQCGRGGREGGRTRSSPCPRCRLHHSYYRPGERHYTGEAGILNAAHALLGFGRLGCPLGRLGRSRFLGLWGDDCALRGRDRELGSKTGGRGVEGVDTHISVHRILFCLLLCRLFGCSCGGRLGLACRATRCTGRCGHGHRFFFLATFSLER